MAVDVGADGQDEFFQIAEDSAPQAILGQVAKKTFHHIQPRRARGSEVQMKARVPRQPALHFAVLMGGVVVADQVKLPIHRNGLVDQTEKLEPFLVSMSLLTQAKDFGTGILQARPPLASPFPRRQSVTPAFSECV